MARVPRVHLPALEAGERELEPEASRYLTRVHRLTTGASFIAFDPEMAIEADGELIAADGRRARVRLGEPRRATRAAAREITLLQGLGKGDKADQVVRDATALGAARIVLVQSERSVVRVDDPARAEARRRRWRAIAADSARQSGRADLPDISGPGPLPAALSAVSAPARLVLDPSAPRPLAAAVEAGAGAIALLIGPEGGFSPDELALAAQHGFLPASLGALVLRTETAAVAVLGAVVALSAKREP
jgi:16S rRNA (uracil1498-N3)-methyltransferase